MARVVSIGERSLEASCERKSLALTIGPATNCGKKPTNRAKSRRLSVGSRTRLCTSIE